jgi:hypothetical protein
LLVRSILATRPNSDFDVNDVYFILDGCTLAQNNSHKNKVQALSAFTDEGGTPLDKCEKTIYVMMEEEEIKARKGCVRGMNAIDQVQPHLSLVANGATARLCPNTIWVVRIAYRVCSYLLLKGALLQWHQPTRTQGNVRSRRRIGQVPVSA